MKNPNPMRQTLSMWIKYGPTLPPFQVLKHKATRSKGEHQARVTNARVWWMCRNKQYKVRIHNVAQVHVSFGTKCKYMKVQIFCKRLRPFETKANTQNSLSYLDKLPSHQFGNGGQNEKRHICLDWMNRYRQRRFGKNYSRFR